MSYDYLKRLPDKGRRLLGMPRQRSAARRSPPQVIARPREALHIAAAAYFHKPAVALFQSFALAGFQAAGTRLRRPLLDLGCGDGSFGSALLRVTGEDRIDVGADLDMRSLKRGLQRRGYDSLERADAQSLPFPDEAFEATFSHCAVCCMDRDPALVLREIYRVTRHGGELVYTVATDHFNRNYVLSRWLERAGFRLAAARYRAAVDRRMSHVYCPPAAQWIRLTREAGFDVLDAAGFADDRLIRLYSVLIWTPFRVFAVLRLIPLAPLQRGAARLLEAVFRPIYRRACVRLEANDASYILIRARKR